MTNLKEEAALATSWIKDRPEGLQLRTGWVKSSLQRNITADVQYAIDKCESLGAGQQLILHGNPSALAKDFSPKMAVLRRHFFAKYALPVLWVASGHPRWRF